jgi:hypothetical protein
MTELRPDIRAALDGLRRHASPPAGIESRMLAQFHARLAGPDGGGDGGPSGGSDAGSALTGSGSAAKLAYAAKVVGATVGLIAIGLTGLIGVATVVRDPVETAAGVDASEHGGEGPGGEGMGEGLGEGLAGEVARDQGPAESQPPPSGSPAVNPQPPERGLAERRSSTPAPTQPSTVSADDSLAAELAIIEAARQAKPADALRHLADHARRFPEGALAREREALWATSACAQNRPDAARAAIERLLARDPGPLLRQRVATACAEKLDQATTDRLVGGDGSNR